MFRRFLDPLMLNTLTVEASRIAEQARKNANWSSKIPGAISVTPAQIEGDGRYTISIVVDLKDAPMARAFEYGSGERATKGEAIDYPIEAKNASALSFLWKYPSPLGRKYLITEDEHVKFKRIMHPGVAPRPYLRPAIDNYRPTLKARLAKAMKRGLLDGIHVEFKDVSKTS